MTQDRPPAVAPPLDPLAITRPAPALMRYYALLALLSGPLFPITIIPLACKYLTLRYRFDGQGISMSWGVLFRREILLTYRRIQDIHLTRNLLQRWLGLASVAVQTASGSAAAEMTIEGILEAEALRDFLYSQMRGARDEDADAHEPHEDADEPLRLLTEIRDLLIEAAHRREVKP